MGSMGSAHAADSQDTTAPTPTEFTDLKQLETEGAQLTLTSSGSQTKKFEIQNSQLGMRILLLPMVITLLLTK